MNNLFDYTQKMDTLRFTPEQKARLAANVVAAVSSEEKTQRRRRPIGKTVLIAACLAAALTVGAGASGVLKPVVDVFAPLFGVSVAQTEIIDKIGHPIGASDTDNGVTITADAIMGDEYNAVIVYTISRDDGQPILPEGVEANQLIAGGFSGSSWVLGGSHGSAYFTQNGGALDSTVQYVESISSDKPLSKGTATAEFSGLSYSDGNGELQTLLEGHWKFRFDVDYEDTSIRLGSGETFSQNGINFTIDEISVSPIAVRVAYTADAEVVWSNAPSGRMDPDDSREVQRYLENVEILLTKTDGSVIDLSGAGGSISPENGVSVCTKGQVLEQIVPLSELSAVSVGGVVFEIPPQG